MLFYNFFYIFLKLIIYNYITKLFFCFQSIFSVKIMEKFIIAEFKIHALRLPICRAVNTFCPSILLFLSNKYLLQYFNLFFLFLLFFSQNCMLLASDHHIVLVSGLRIIFSFFYIFWIIQWVFLRKTSKFRRVRKLRSLCTRS